MQHVIDAPDLLTSVTTFSGVGCATGLQDGLVP